MSFLTLCQDVCRECGVAGGDSVPSAVTGQTGELDRVVNWVKNRWTEVQNRHQTWKWMRHGFTFDTVADDDTYAYGDITDTTASAVITRLGRWWVDDEDDPAKIYLTSTGVGGQGYLCWLPWDAFKAIYRIGTQNSGVPAHITVDPQNRIVIGPKPNGIFTITGDYQRSAQVMTDDADVPEMPTQFHSLVAYLAMEDYGYFESAPEVLARGQKHGNRLMRQLEANQLPPPKMPPPLC